jgi:hypothetical protein
MESDAEIAVRLIEDGADVNCRADDGRTPLHLAIYQRTAEVLVSNGADIHAVDKYGRTPLHAAADMWKADVAELLLSSGADSNAKDDTGQIPLHKAAHDFRPSVVRALLEHGSDANARDGEGNTPASLASRKILGDEQYLYYDRDNLSEDVRQVRDLLREHRGEREQPACSACGGCTGSPASAESLIINCTCGKPIAIREEEIDKSRGLRVHHWECGRTVYIPPGVWCDVCRENLRPDWTSRIVVT